MDGWKHGKPYAMVVCPVYQLPSRTSQIYQQAGARSVCIGTYTHLAVLAQYAQITSKAKAMTLVHELFKSIEAMNPSKDATVYWQIVNRTMLDFDRKISEIWRIEKRASIESIYLSRNEALGHLATVRKRIMSLSKNEAIKEILKLSKIKNKIMAINSVVDNELLNYGQS